MAFDALISDTARAFREGLAAPDRQEFEAILEVLLDDPLPDGIAKVELPVPYRPGTYGYAAGSFWIAYRFLNPLVLLIVAAYWSPASPHYLS